MSNFIYIQYNCHLGFELSLTYLDTTCLSMKLIRCVYCHEKKWVLFPSLFFFLQSSWGNPFDLLLSCKFFSWHLEARLTSGWRSSRRFPTVPYCSEQRTKIIPTASEVMNRVVQIDRVTLRKCSLAFSKTLPLLAEIIKAID